MAELRAELESLDANELASRLNKHHSSDLADTTVPTTEKEAVDWLLKIEGEGTKVIILDRSEFNKVIESETINAENSSLSGWRIPIYLDDVEIDKEDSEYEEITGSFSSGGWLSGGSYQPDAIEITSVKSWFIDTDYLEEGFDRDEEVKHQTNYYLWEEGGLDSLIEGVEQTIQEHFQWYEQTIEIKWI